MNYKQVLDIIYTSIPLEYRPVYTLADDLDYSTLVWEKRNSVCDKPTKNFLDNEILRFTSRYSEFRSRLYPTAEEWIIAFIQKELDNQPEYWNELANRRAEIKETYPKP